MSSSTRRLCTGCLIVFPLAVLASACGPKTDAPVQIVVTEEGPRTPSEVELSEPKVTLVEPGLVRFEVKYRFTKGKPDRFYSCDISFPGTPNHGVKMMQDWQLKAEGVIKDGVALSEPPVKSFEIYLSEAPTGNAPYKKISNVVSGPVQ